MQQASAFDELQNEIDSFNNRRYELAEQLDVFESYLEMHESEPRKHARIIDAINMKIQDLKDEIDWLWVKINNRETMQMLLEQDSVRMAKFEQRQGARFADYTQNVDEQELKRQFRLLDEDRADHVITLRRIKKEVVKNRERYGDDVDLRQHCKLLYIK